MSIWTLPNTVDKAVKLQQLMNEPLTKDEAERNLFNVLGDDLLMDIIGNMRGNQDARPFVALRLSAIMHMPLFSFEKPWEPDAVKICKKILQDREMGQE